MAQETEHKYLVIDDSYVSMSHGVSHIVQGYLSRDADRTVRVRIRDNRGFLTVKGRNHGDTRLEFEYCIPLDDARQMLTLCEGTILEKERYLVDYRGHVWEVDRYITPSRPTVAEIELPSSDIPYDLPPFAGKNVTGDPAYYNSNL